MCLTSLGGLFKHHHLLTVPFTWEPKDSQETNENKKLVGSWAGKQVLTWSSRSLRKACLKEVRGLGKAEQGSLPLLLRSEYRGAVWRASR